MPRIYDFSQISLLVVEDNDFMAGLVTSMLSALRVGRVLRGRSGEEAKNIIDSRASGGPSLYGVDIVLSDWHMTPVDGLELLKWVRAHRKDSVKFLPFIMLTAYPERQRVLTARDAGVTEFLRKPVRLETVITRLVEVIERPRPFVKCDSYFGPDRRRKIQSFEGPDRRAPEDDEAIPRKLAANG